MITNNPILWCALFFFLFLISILIIKDVRLFLCIFISFLFLISIKVSSNWGCVGVGIIYFVVSCFTAGGLFSFLYTEKNIFLNTIFKPQSKIKKILSGKIFLVITSFIAGFMYANSLLVFLYQPFGWDQFPIFLSPFIFYFFYSKLILNFLKNELKEDAYQYIRNWGVILVFSFVMFILAIIFNILDLYYFDNTIKPFFDERIYDSSQQLIKHSCKIFKFIVRVSYISGENIDALKNLSFLNFIFVCFIRILLTSLTTYMAAGFYFLGVCKLCEKCIVKDK